MYELTYCSFTDRAITNIDIENILKTARDFNLKNNITGCLLFHNKQFIQILEGDEKNVGDLYKKIQEDTRHAAVRLLSAGTKEERMFNGWSMAYLPLVTKNVEKLLFADNIKAFSELIEKPSPAIEIFWRRAKLLVEENEG